MSLKRYLENLIRGWLPKKPALLNHHRIQVTRAKNQKKPFIRRMRSLAITPLFCVAVFFLTGMGLAVFHYDVLHEMFGSLFWFTLAYIVAWAVLLDFAVDFVRGKGEVKLSVKKVLALTFGVMLVSIPFTHVVYTIVTPSWSFSVSTDKSTYRLGELVTIAACLRNTGIITHSFTSASSNPVFVDVEYSKVPTMWPYGYTVWFSPLSEGVTEFSVGPNETIERHFSWNQTNTRNPSSWNQTYMPGTYMIFAYIPRNDPRIFSFDNMPLFEAWTTINITST